MSAKKNRDSERNLSSAEFVATLRRAADAIESGEKLEVRVAGERVYVPSRATFSIEHERDGGDEELEFQIRWSE